MNGGLFFRLLRLPIKKYYAQQCNIWPSIVSTQSARDENTSAKRGRIEQVLDKLKSFLHCSEKDATDIYDDYPSVRSIEYIPKVKENINILQRYGVTADTIINNAFVLIMEKESLERKIDHLNKIQMRSMNDFVPMLEMTEEQLGHFCELSTESETNRIYHFSDKFMIAPNIVAKHFARCCEVACFGPLNKLDQTVQLLLDYNIEPMNILKGLYVMHRNDEVLLNRLEQLKENRCDIFVRHLYCTDEEFQKVLNKQSISIGDTGRIKTNNASKLHIESVIMEMIGCDYGEAATIYHTKLHPGICLDLLKSNVDLLKEHGADNDALRANFEITLMPSNVLRQKLGLLSGISSLKINDLLPLVSVDDTTLNILIRNMNDDHHAIVYFSKTLNVSMMNVFKSFAIHPRVLIQQPSDLQTKLDFLLANDNFDRDSILNHSLILIWSLESIRKRLIELSQISTGKIKAYMITQQMPYILNALARKEKEMEDLAEFSGSTLEYLSNRFGWTDDQVHKAVEAKPFLLKLTFDKAKKFTDFILNETHFTGADVLQCLRILMHSQEETRSRYNELTAIGLKPISMTPLLLDKKRYIKFIRSYCERENADWHQIYLIEKRVKEKKCG